MFTYIVASDMPKSFLMNAKRKKMIEEMYKDEATGSESETSSIASSDDSGVPDSLHTTDLQSSPEHDAMTVSSALNHSNTSAFVAMATRTVTTPFPRNTFAPMSAIKQSEGNGLSMYPSFFSISLPPLPKVCAEQPPNANSPLSSVDTSIPFTTYLSNLSKILKGSKPENCTGEKLTAPSPTPEDHSCCTRHATEECPKTPPKERNLHFNSPSVLRHQLSSPPSLYSKLFPRHPMTLGMVPELSVHPALLPRPGFHHRRPMVDKPPAVKKYKCDTCGKAFSRSNTLVTHKRIHTGDKPFKCEQCGRAFRQPGNLTRHRLTHTTFKPYVCPTCNKAFNRASNLHTHMRTHTDYKPFVCPYCGKGFHQKIDMKIHSYTHTGERPHKCDVCGKGFTLITTLNAHMRTHLAEPLPCVCHLCGAICFNQAELSNHLVTSHPGGLQIPV